MHIVFLSERLVPLNLACNIYYATWNQTAQRLDYVSQASILQLGPWGRPLVYTHAEESLSVHRLSPSVPREGWLGGAIGCVLRVVPDGYTCLLRFVGCFACKDMIGGVYIYTSWGY